jgi:hypothetical protein
MLGRMTFVLGLFLVETVLCLLCDTISKTGVKLCLAYSVCPSRDFSENMVEALR